MAEGEVGRNLTFPIFNSDGTPFNDLVLHKATYDSVVMSLGDKISGDVYYRGTDLAVTMGEYVEYEGVKFVLVSPPVIVREGMVSDNSELKGLAKYSFTFYHPMYMLANFPFSDVAVSNDQKKYLSENKSFSWIGNLTDFVAKINKNLDNTQWYCDISLDVQQSDREKLSEVMAFDNESIADAIKRGYETWKFPYIIDSIKSTDTRYSTQYAQGKRFLIQFGLPTRQIVKNSSTFIFEYGQGVGLKNNSRTPRNNKIITRIAGYGSEDNIPYGYPQIQWYGNQSWDYTINNNPSAANSYPIYDGIVGGQKVRLIKHPFTRTHLMPTIYATTLFNKISQYLANGNANPNYDPTLELVDYYDADNTYPNPIVANSPSYEIHEFEDIKPELQSRQISSVGTYDGKYKESVTMNDFLDLLEDFITQSQYDKEKEQLEDIKNGIGSHDSDSGSVTPPVSAVDARLYSCKWSYYKDDYYAYVKYESNGQNFEYIVRLSDAMPTPDWDDTMDDDGNYVQSYFTLTLPALGFDLYACAAITQEMSINMRSGACLGCTFPVMVDWDDYKKNFYDDEGNFDPVIGTGHPRDAQKYPNSTSAAITVVVQKDLNTFGTLMPNIYQKPAANDDFVILGISLPQSYVTNAQTRLEQDMKQYMRDNNVHYYDYPLKFDEYFLANNTDILQQMRPNVVVKFKYNDTTLALYIKQFTVKFGDKPLPEYNITLTDDVEIVLNDIGKVSEEVSNLRILMGEGGGGGGLNDNRYLRKDKDDTAAGLIRLIKGLQVGEQFVSGLLGEGGIFRKDADGTTYLECDKMYVRMKAYFDTVEVRRFIHSGGNRIASAAGIKCSRVEWLTSGNVVTDNINNAVKFRCYFRANDDGKQITNDFEANDLAYCKETNINVSQGLSQRFYWRKVVGVSSSVNADGEHYIDLSKSDCLSGSDYPLAQDDIIQLGNTTDTQRQGAIVEYVSGEDAPSYQIYQGINTYNLERKNYVSLGYKSDTGRAYMNVYGDFYFGDRPASGHTEGNSFIRYNQETGELDVKANVDFTHPESTYGTENLDDFIAAITQNIGDIQDQVDGNIESWFYDYMPVAVDATGAPLNKIPLVINNGSPVHPYYDWYTIDGGGTAHEVRTEREKHLGDTFYDNSSGYAFRFTLNSSTNAFEWTIIEDSAVIKALADAAKAQDTADHKRRAFVLPVTIGGVTYNHPYPPYDVGDLWLNAKYPYNYDGVTDAENNKYNNDVLRCITSQDANGSFSISHWVLASKYTDDTVVNDFIDNTYAPFVQNIQNQVDKKAETWYQDGDPSSAWTTAEVKAKHVGDIWCDTSANGGKKTYIWKDFGTSANPRYAWAAQAVPDAVFDTIDGKCAIYVAWNAWMDSNNQSLLQVKDLLIPQADISQTIGGVTYNYKKDKVYRCIDASTPVFREIEYTDDTTVNNIISRYGNILGITPTAGNVGEALGYLREVLGGSTSVDGGLILSNLIAMRDNAATPSIWGGISGTYRTSETGSGFLGHGTAAWYGGAMVDKETLAASVAVEANWPTYRWARTLFRFDGSGYVADGNISWDKTGTLTIKGNVVDTTTLKIGGTTVNLSDYLPKAAGSGEALTGDLYANNIVPNASAFTASLPQYYSLGSADRFWQNLFVKRIYLYKPNANNDTGAVYIEYNTTSGSEGVHLVGAGMWTESYLSALGLNSSGGGGSGVQLNEPLNGINNSGLSAPSAGTMTGTVIVFNGSNGWTYSHNRGIYAASVSSGSTVTAASGFVKQGHTNDEVLLAGGGTSNLKTINGNSIMGSGNIVVSSGSVTSIVIGNSSPYEPTDGTVILPAYPDEKKAGTYQSSNFLYLIGSESSSSTNANATAATKTNPNCYISSNCLYSNGSKVLTVGTYTLDDVADGTTRKLSDYTKTANLGSMAFADTNDYALASDTVFKVKVGTTEYTPSSGTVSLPAYVVLSDLNNYLPLTAGDAKPVTGVLFVKNIVKGWNYTNSNNAAAFVFDKNGSNATGIGSHNISDTIWFGACSSAGAWIDNYKQIWQFNGEIKAEKITIDANSTGFLKANGTIDTATYVASSTLNNYVSLATTQTISGQKTMTGGLIVEGRIYGSGYDEGILIKPAANGYAGLILGSSTENRFAMYLLTGTSTFSPHFILKHGSSSYSINVPLKSGTIALTSDIPTVPDVSSYINAIIVNDDSPVGATNHVVTLSNIARRGSSNNLIEAGNEFNFVPSNYIGVGVYFNYKGAGGALTTTKGIETYRFFNGKGSNGTYAYILAKGYKVDGGTSSGFLKADGSVDTNTYTTASDFVAKTGDTMTGKLTVKSPIFGYNFNNSGANKAAFIFDKPGSNYTGIGAHSTSDTIWFGACSDTNGTWVDSYKQKWQFNGQILAETASISGDTSIAGTLSMAGNITPSTDAQYSLGSSSKRFSAVYAGSFVKTGGTSSQFLKADGSVDSNTYLTSGSVVTTNTAQSITGAKTFTATLTSSAGGNFTGGLAFYSICVECASNGTPDSGRSGEINRYGSQNLHLQYDDGTGSVTMCRQGFTFSNTGTRSITINASLQLTCGSGTPYTDKNWVYNSDMRKKDVIRLIDMDAQRIADAPIFDFTWKSDDVKVLTLGSSAQYWQTVFPNAVRQTPDGFLGMDYCSIALASAVLTARKVVDHEKRIRLLEVENEALRREIDQLKLKNAA